MGVAKGAAVCPVDDNSIFVIRKHGSVKNGQRQGSISRQNSINSHQSKQSKISRLTLDEDLEMLRAANIVFIRQIHNEADKLANMPNKYAILNSCGETMFWALEVTDAMTRSTFADNQPFKFSVVNTQGEEVFDVDGHPGIQGVGAEVTVRRDAIILGNVAQINKLSLCQRQGSPCYLIEAPDGRTLQKILRQESWKSRLRCWATVNDFDVFSPDGTICRAKISRQRNSISLEEYSQADTYALSFHTTDMDGKLKAILLSAVLMLDFQFFEKRAGADYRSLFLRILCCIFIVSLLVALIIAVIISTIQFQKEKSSRFPGQIPPAK